MLMTMPCEECGSLDGCWCPRPIRIKLEQQIQVQCWECEERLIATLFGGKILVKPCPKCKEKELAK